MIGPTFFSELVAAGVSLNGYSWDPQGNFTYRDDVPQSVRDAVAAVYAKHDPTKTLVPASISPLQARKALRQVGLLNQVNAAVPAAEASSPGVTDAWQYASSISRSDPFVALLAPQFNLTSDAVDNLFRLAATL